MNEVHINPIDENLLDDKRNVIAENCFTELDIALKSYRVNYLEDSTFYELSLLHSSFAFLIGNIDSVCKLTNVNINEFSIPNSPFFDKDNNKIDKPRNLEPKDLIYFIMNMLVNSKQGFLELEKSGFFLNTKESMGFIDKHSLLAQIRMMYDRCILCMNLKYSRNILKINP